MSFRDSVESVWEMVIHHSLLYNALKLVGLDPDHRRHLGGLMPEFYGTEDHDAGSLLYHGTRKHRVTGVKITSNGRHKYYVKTGLITLQDKLVCSFLAWPLTLLEALVYLLAVPFALAVTVLFALFFVVYVPIVYIRIFFLQSPSEGAIKGKDFYPIFSFLLGTAALGLVMAPYRLFQAIFRIPVGFGLLIKAGIDKLLDREETPRTIQALDLENKTADEIRALGIKVEVKPAVVRPAPAENNRNHPPLLPEEGAFEENFPYEDEPQIIPWHGNSFFSSPAQTVAAYTGTYPVRYICPVLLDVTPQPVLLSDGHFYDQGTTMNIHFPGGEDKPHVKSPLTGDFLANKKFYVIPSFAQELNAFNDALTDEAKQPKPNYEPILALAGNAEKTAEEMRHKINQWIKTYNALVAGLNSLNKDLEKFKPEEHGTITYRILKAQQETSNASINASITLLIAEIAKDNSDFISQALSVAFFLHPDSARVNKTQKELLEDIRKNWPPVEIVECFLTLDSRSDLPKGMKECLTKALQEAIIETYNFPAQFAALAKNSAVQEVPDNSIQLKVM